MVDTAQMPAGLNRRTAFQAAQAQGDSNYLSSIVSPVLTPAGNFAAALAGRTVGEQQALDAQRGVTPAAAAPAPAVPADLTFGSAMGALPRGTTAQGGLSFSPVMEYTPEQERVRALGEALSGLPPQMFQQMMAGIPQRPAAPSQKEMRTEDYYTSNMADLAVAERAATTQEELDAIRKKRNEVWLTIMGIPLYEAPQLR